jgi:hypothetical protein
MIRKIFWLMVVLYGVQPFLFAQTHADFIKEAEVARTIQVLASDSLRGRGNGTPDLLKAGFFIADRFQRAGLRSLSNQLGFYIPFFPFSDREQAFPDILEWNDKPVSADKFMFINPKPGNYATRKLNDFKVIQTDSCFTNQILNLYDSSDRDILIWTSKKQPDNENIFPEVILIPEKGISRSFLLVYSDIPPDSMLLTGVDDYYNSLGYNIIGVLPGKSKPEEIVLFSAHYDHLGVNHNRKKDSILNGANDDASGVTALIHLAEYFAKKGDNERTILFCAFSGEELGLKGSANFINYLNPEKVIAGINIEMIGVPQYGINNIFITGTQYSSLPSVLNQRSKEMGIKIKPEPDLRKRLFQRSDNYTFVKAGVPAHTIMSSDDDDKCYHKPCDEVKRINIPHMTQIIRTIAVMSESIISGIETPTRVKAEELR